MKPPYGPQCRRAEPIGRGRRPNSATRALQRSFALSSSLPSHFLRSVPLASSRFRSAFRRAPSSSLGHVYLSFCPPRRVTLPVSPFPPPRVLLLAASVSFPFSLRSLPPSLSPTPLLLRVQRECATQVSRARARPRGDTRTQLCSAPLRFASLRRAPRVDVTGRCARVHRGQH